jgi:hypothetical protein
MMRICICAAARLRDPSRIDCGSWFRRSCCTGTPQHRPSSASARPGRSRLGRRRRGPLGSFVSRRSGPPHHEGEPPLRRSRSAAAKACSDGADSEAAAASLHLERGTSGEGEWRSSAPHSCPPSSTRSASHCPESATWGRGGERPQVEKETDGGEEAALCVWSGKKF